MRSKLFGRLKDTRAAALVRDPVKRALIRTGFRFAFCRNVRGIDPFFDMWDEVSGKANPLVLDVGANTGQSVLAFKKTFPGGEIHSFEPGSAAFAELLKKTRHLAGIHPNNVGVGARTGSSVLLENSHSSMSSILRPGPACWGEIVGETTIPLVSLDDYCARKGISSVDILKSDTQGYDLEVLRGASGLLRDHKIRMVYMEITFSRMYEHLPSLDEIWGFLRRNDFELVTLYRCFYQDRRASWTDALFVDPLSRP